MALLRRSLPRSPWGPGPGPGLVVEASLRARSATFTAAVSCPGFRAIYSGGSGGSGAQWRARNAHLPAVCSSGDSLGSEVVPGLEPREGLGSTREISRGDCGRRPVRGRSPGGGVVLGGHWLFQWLGGLGIGKKKASFARVPGSCESGLEALWLSVPVPIPHGIVPSWGPAPLV